MKLKHILVAALVCATTVALPVLAGAMDIRTFGTFGGLSGTVTAATGAGLSSCIGFGNSKVGEACNNSSAWTIGTDGASLNIYYGNQIRMVGSQASGSWTTLYEIVANDFQTQANGYLSFDAKADIRTDPTVVACSGTAASMTSANGTAAFRFDVGTSCAGESTATVTLPAATTGWVCSCSSETADRMIQQKAASSTTAVVLTNVVISTGAAGDFTDSADVFCQCRGY